MKTAERQGGRGRESGKKRGEDDVIVFSLCIGRSRWLQPSSFSFAPASIINPNISLSIRSLRRQRVTNCKGGNGSCRLEETKRKSPLVGWMWADHQPREKPNKDVIWTKISKQALGYVQSIFFALFCIMTRQQCRGASPAQKGGGVGETRRRVSTERGRGRGEQEGRNGGEIIE